MALRDRKQALHLPQRVKNKNPLFIKASKEN